MNVFGASAQMPLPPTNAIPTSQKILRALPTPILKAANSSFMTATSSSITSSLPKQKRNKRERRSNTIGGKGGSRTATLVGYDNKENYNLSGLDAKGKHAKASAEVTRPNLASENMDQIRPTGTSPISVTVAASTEPRHRRSTSSAVRSRRHPEQDRILTAASNQLAEKERQQTYDSRLTHAIWQLATTGANPAVDLLVCLERRQTIGFRYVDITRPVVIHHGSKDTRVPVENVKWLGKTMRRCEVRVLEGEGHGLMASATVMGGILMEISTEWDEWGRVTGETGRDREKRDREARKGAVAQVR
jgi:hypothetical protein